MVWPSKIINALVGSTQQFGGDIMNLFHDLVTGVNIAASDSSLKPDIATEFNFRNSLLGIKTPNNNNRFYFEVLANPSTAEDKKIGIPALILQTDNLVFNSQPATLTGKVMDYNSNTFQNLPAIGNAAGNTATFSGNATNKIFTMAHGYSGTPNSVVVVPKSVDALGDYVVTWDATNITVTYQQAPATGTNNVVLSWMIATSISTSGFTPGSTDVLTNKTYSSPVFTGNATFASELDFLDSAASNATLLQLRDQTRIGRTLNNYNAGLNGNPYTPFFVSESLQMTDTPVDTGQTDAGYTNITRGIWSHITYGTASTVNAIGTPHNFSATLDIQGSTDANNEFANYFGYMTFNGSNTGRAWFTDFTVHGPSVQPSLLSGITMLVNNKYNGSPSGAPSGIIWAATRAAAGPGASSTIHNLPNYALDCGIGIVGFGGTDSSQAKGFTVGLQIGGNGSGWISNASGYGSWIGTGISIKDVDTAGITFNNVKTANVAPAINFGNDSSHKYTYGIDFTNNQFTTALMNVPNTDVLLGSSQKVTFTSGNIIDLQGVGTNVPSILRLIPTHSTVGDSTNRSELRLRNSSDATNAEYLSLLAQGQNGYIIAGQQSGTGTIRDIKMRVAGSTTALLLNGSSAVLDFRGGATYRWYNSANTFYIQMGIPNQTANATLNLPLLTANDTIAALGITNIFSVGQQFDNYIDMKEISTPANPAAGYGRLYPKAIDANNTGWFSIVKREGSFVEVRVA